MIARGAAATLVLGVIAAIGIAGATAIRARVGTRSNERPAPGDVPQPADSARDSVPALPADSAPTEVPRRSAGTTSGSGPAVAPVVPVGRTVLRDTMVADRAGDTVRVSFDLVMARTRRPEKFEAIVRSTLPQVYGAAADSALRALPVGSVARAGDLVTTLTQQGFHIPLPDGRAIGVWPETRAGRDGPLVIAYRAVASR
jgi:hypothetical protein